jgi:transcriptional antiterminator NusG
MFHSHSAKENFFFKPGMNVRILEGPFKEFRGKIKAVNQATKKVTTIVNFFGKDVQAEFDYTQIAPELPN